MAMKKRVAFIFSFAILVAGAVAAENAFLNKLRDRVLLDEDRLKKLLNGLEVPRDLRPNFDVCHFWGEEAGYDYSYCLYSGANPPGCPMGSLTLQYLGPAGYFDIVSKEYHESELMYRVSIVNIDTDGKICYDFREKK
jgi:hypothetical protein